MEFTDKEEVLFDQLAEWLSNTVRTAPVCLSKKYHGLDVNCCTRTVTNDKGQVFTKEQIYENV